MKKRIQLADFKALLAAAKGAGAEIASVELPVRSKWPQKRVDGVVFRDVAFESPIVGGGIFGRTQFDNCRFVSCDWGGVNASKVDFVGCEFVRSKVGGGLMASLASCGFQDCILRECDIVSVEFSACRLQGVKIEASTVMGSNFRGGTWTGVAASGLLRTVNFLGCDLCDVDLSEAKLLDFTIIGGRQLRVAVPQNPHDFFVAAEAFLAVRQELGTVLSAEGFRIYSEIAEILGRAGGREHVDEAIFSEMPACDRELVMQALFRRSATGHP